MKQQMAFWAVISLLETPSPCAIVAVPTASLTTSVTGPTTVATIPVAATLRETPIGFEATDVPDLLKTALRPSVLWFVCKSLIKAPFARRKEAKEVLQAVPAKAA